MNYRVAVVGIGWYGFRPVTPEVSYKEMVYQAAVRAQTPTQAWIRADILRAL